MDREIPSFFRRWMNAENFLVPLYMRTFVCYNVTIPTRTEDATMRDVTEALDIFDQLTDEQKRDALEHLRKTQKGKGAA